jgi:hypothetical protein
VVREKRLVRCEVLVFGQREKRKGRLEGGFMEGLYVEGVQINLEGLSACSRGLQVGRIPSLSSPAENSAQET